MTEQPLTMDNFTAYSRGMVALPSGQKVAEQIVAAQLIQARTGLAMEINAPAGMIPSARVNARTLIPVLASLGVTRVEAPFSKKKKIRAHSDVNWYMVERGFDFRPLSAELSPAAVTRLLKAVSNATGTQAKALMRELRAAGPKEMAITLPWGYIEYDTDLDTNGNETDAFYYRTSK
jgi:hypothetical protein